MMADQLVLQAQQAVSGAGDIRDDQLQRAAVLLDLALELTPKDAELWRLRSDLASMIDDDETRRHALRQYVRLRPDDDAARLSLIFNHLSSFQTADKRMAEVHRVLEHKSAARLSEPLRSRLWTLVARLAQELGDDDKLTPALQKAVSLDPANRDAAAMAFALARERDAPRYTQIALLANLVKADPADPRLRAELANALFLECAYESAADQFRATRELTGQLDPAIASRRVVALAASDQLESAEQLLTEIDRARREARRARRAEARARDEADADPDNPADADPDNPADAEPGDAASTGAKPRPRTAQTPEMPGQDQPDSELRSRADARAERGADSGLSVNLELMRYVVLERQGKSQQADASFARIVEMLEARQARSPVALGDLIWLRVFFDRQRELALARVDELGVDDPRGKLARGWAALEGGWTEQAMELLEPLAMEGQPFAEYAVAKHELNANPPDGLSRMQELIAAQPFSLVAVIGSLDLIERDFTSPVTKTARQLESLFKSWDGVLLHPDPTQSQWTATRLEIEPPRYQYLEPMTARVTVRNGTSIPLSFGGAGVLPHTLFLYSQPRQAGVAMPDPGPVVVDAGRRLTLKPREQMTLDVSLDRTNLGWTLANSPGAKVTFDLLAVLDPIPQARDRYATGLMGSADNVFHLERLALPLTEANLDRWLDVLNEPDPSARLRVLARFAIAAADLNRRGRDAEDDSETSNGDAPSAGGDDDGELASLADAMIRGVRARFERGDPITRAWIVRFLATRRDNMQTFKPLLESALASKDELVSIVALASIPLSPDAAVIERAKASDKPRVARFAAALQSALRAEAAAREKQQEQAESESQDG